MIIKVGSIDFLDCIDFFEFIILNNNPLKGFALFVNKQIDHLLTDVLYTFQSLNWIRPYLVDSCYRNESART